jgi:NAD dependent epimerase/dehydratase family enzyme
MPLFSLGLGARIGDGKQFLSWIHIEDLARAVAYIMEGKKGGIYNLTAPGYCNNRVFTAKLAGSLQKHARLVVPKIVFRIIYGRRAAIITGGQAVIPDRLINEGFSFKYPNIEDALADIVK